MKTPVHNIFSDTGCIRQDVLISYRDQTISANEKHEVERHLIDCELCSDALEGIAMVSSTAVIDDVRNRVKEQTAGKRGTSNFSSTRMMLIAATISIVVFLSYFTWQQFEKDVAPKNILTHVESDKNELPVERSTSPSLTANNNDSTPLSQSVQSENNAIEKENRKPSTPAVSSIAAVEDDAIAYDLAEVTTELDEEIEDEPVYESTAITKKETTEMKSGVSSSISSISADDILRSNHAAASNTIYVNELKVYVETDSKNKSKVKTASPAKNKSISSKYENKDALATAEEPPIERRELSYIEALKLALVEYENKNYDEAIKQLKDIEKVYPNDKNVDFYTGISNYNLSNYRAAVNSLEALTTDESGVFNEEAEYYSALSYYKSGKVKKGISMLENISSNGGFYADNAKQFLIQNH
jgi:tetratricopeptide (TPR) repeat protein